jgi:hypothetical protein
MIANTKMFWDVQKFLPRTLSNRKLWLQRRGQT